MKTETKFIIATIIAIIGITLTSCGMKATYTSPKTGIVYGISKGEDGKPRLDVKSPEGALYEKDGIKIEKAK